MVVLLADLQRKFEAANQAVIHTEQVLGESREILAASLSTEATARGYLLSHDPAFLDLHRAARKRVMDGFSQILQGTEDNPGQQERMRASMRLMREEIAALEAQISAPTAADLPAAVNASRHRLETLGSQITDFESEERRLLAVRGEQSLAHRDRMRLMLWGFAIVGVLAAVFGSLLFMTGFKRRLDRIAENAARFSRRESNGPVDGSADAIGRLEKALIMTTGALLDRERLLSENAVELERAKSAAEAAAQAKTEFVATISHEIRSPMNALLGAAELLSATGLDEKQREYAGMLTRAGNNLLSVINDVLDHSKLEAGRLELERVPFECAATVNRVVELLSVSASEKGLHLVAKCLPGVPKHLTGDPNRLQRVLINLVSNAIKFTAAGVVAVRVEPAEPVGYLHFSVADTGIGIPPDRLEAIFQKFTQAGVSTTREYGGTGLGLAICRQIVEMMGGRIWVESELGAGSTFHFTAALPAAEPLPATPRTGVPAKEKLRSNALRARILLAEDSESNVALMKAYLSETGYIIDIASDGETALGHLIAGHYNLALMDVQMPKLDGYEVTRRFREWERSQSRARTPILSLTAHAFQEDTEQAIKAGADAHLTKPIRRETLLEAIELYQRPDGGSDIRVEVPDFVRELAPEFLRRQRYGLLSVASALKEGEFQSIQSFAHNMKGAGQSFGFEYLTDLGRQMEMAAKDRDAGALSKQFTSLKEYLTSVDVA